MKRLFAALALLLSAHLGLCSTSYAQSPTPQSNDSPDTTRYAVLMMGKPARTETSTVTASGERQITFEYNDRGRGPKLTSRIAVGAGGVPTLIETAGNDYLKAAVDERFTLSGGRATWKNKAEQGERAVAGPAFYVTMDGSPEEEALLAQALLAAPGGRLALLPEGEARIERVGDLKVSAKGQERTVTQYSISGLGFTPFPVWLDSDKKFFASVSSWLSVIREGFEESTPVLLKAQDEQTAARDLSLARTLARRPQGAPVIRNASLFDTETMSVRPHTTVVKDGSVYQTAALYQAIGVRPAR